jgi:hypothetical protein
MFKARMRRGKLFLGSCCFGVKQKAASCKRQANFTHNGYRDFLKCYSLFAARCSLFAESMYHEDIKGKRMTGVQLKHIGTVGVIEVTHRLSSLPLFENLFRSPTSLPEVSEKLKLFAGTRWFV